MPSPSSRHSQHGQPSQPLLGGLFLSVGVLANIILGIIGAVVANFLLGLLGVVLTGWLGGPKATLMSSMPKDKICDSGLSSLANIFGLDILFLREHLVSHKIICWDHQPGVLGGYSYNTIHSTDAKTILQNPIDNTIYFAGEAVYSGDLGGTVEAALASGKMTAGMITGNHSNIESRAGEV